MELPETITADWLAGLGACDEGMEAFAEVFGRGVAPTREAVRRALADSRLDLEWLARRLLGRHDTPLGASAAWLAYRDATLPEFSAYLAARDRGPRAAASEWAAFRAACAEALADSLGLP